jgi:hypothetical protein
VSDAERLALRRARWRTWQALHRARRKRREQERLLAEGERITALVEARLAALGLKPERDPEARLDQALMVLGF